MNEGWGTKVRLACARACVWTLWHLFIFTLRVFLRKDHPLRVYVAGATHEVLPKYLDSLRYSNGARVCPLTRWKMAVAAIAVLALVTPETRLAESLVTFLAGVA